MILHEPSFKVVRSSAKDYKDGCFVLVEPLVFEWQAKRVIIEVQTGFLTNFASVPIGFRNLFPVNDKHRLAAVAHDYLYSCGGVVRSNHFIKLNGCAIKHENGFSVFYTREEADQLFFNMMISEGVKKGKAKAMFLAVKYFGFAAWVG